MIPTAPQNIRTVPGIFNPGQNGYFDMLAARPDKLAVYSLRDPKQLLQPNLGGYAHSNSRPLNVFYDSAFDAARVEISATNNSLQNQVRVPIPNYNGASFMVTWDTYWPGNWRYTAAGIRAYKTFQLASGGNIWTEVRNRFNFTPSVPPNHVGYSDVRYYGAQFSQWGPGTVSAGTVNGRNYGVDALGPIASEFAIAPDKWTRYWTYFRPTATAPWWEFSLWLADEGRDPVCVYDKRLIMPRTSASRWDSFWIEFNTSQAEILAGRPPLVAYVRNIAMLKGLQPNDAASLLVRP